MTDYGREIIANLSQDGIYVTVHGESETDQRVFNVGGNLMFASTKDKNARDLIESLNGRSGKRIRLEKLVENAEKLSSGMEVKGKLFVCGVNSKGSYSILMKDMANGGSFEPKNRFEENGITVDPKSDEQATLESISNVVGNYRPDNFQFGFLTRESTKVLYDPDVCGPEKKAKIPQREYRTGFFSGTKRPEVNARFYNALLDSLDAMGAVSRSAKNGSMKAIYTSVSELIDAYQNASYGILGRIKSRITLWKSGRALRKAYQSVGFEPFKLSEMRAAVLSDGTPVREYMPRNGEQPEVQPSHANEIGRVYCQSFWDSLPAAPAVDEEKKLAQPEQLAKESNLPFGERIQRRYGISVSDTDSARARRIHEKEQMLIDQDN